MPTSYLDFNRQNGYGEIVEKIVEAKRAPIKKKEEEKKKEGRKITSLDELAKELNILDAAAGRLSGVNSAFSDYRVTSDAPDVLTGSARRGAKPDAYQITVEQAPVRHRIQSREVASDEKLPPGDFSLFLGTRRLDFRFGGGSVQAFLKLFQNRADLDKRLRVSAVRKSASAQVIVVSSLLPGENGRLSAALDTGGLLETLELFAPPRPPMNPGPVDLAPGSFGAEGVVVLAPGESRTVLFASNRGFAPGDRLALAVEWKKAVGVKLDPAMALAPPSKLGEGSNLIDVPALQAFDAERLAEANRTDGAPDDAAWGAVKTDRASYPVNAGAISNERGQAVVSLAGFGAGETVREWILQNRTAGTELTFSIPQVERSSNAAVTGSNAQPVHEIDAPRNAVLVYQGVRVEREGSPVGDLIEGVSLEPKSARRDPVTLKIEWNQEAIQQALINFIGQYNVVLGLLNEFQNADPPPADAKDDVKARFGLFRNSSSIQLLRDRLLRLPVNAYPTSQPETLSLLSQIGVARDAYKAGQNPNDVNFGKLDVKEEKFKKSLADMPDLVGELFARDTTGDRVPNQGLAVEASRLVRAAAGAGSLLAAEKETSQRRIKGLDADMKRDEESVETYRKKLVNDFSELERAQKEFERSRKFFDGIQGKQD